MSSHICLFVRLFVFITFCSILCLTLCDGFQHVDLEAEKRPVTPRTHCQLCFSPGTSDCVRHVVSRLFASWSPLDVALCSTSVRALEVSRVAAPRWSEKRRRIPVSCASPSALWSNPKTLDDCHDQAWSLVILRSWLRRSCLRRMQN